MMYRLYHYVFIYIGNECPEEPLKKGGYWSQWLQVSPAVWPPSSEQRPAVIQAQQRCSSHGRNPISLASCALASNRERRNVEMDMLTITAQILHILVKNLSILVSLERARLDHSISVVFKLISPTRSHWRPPTICYEGITGGFKPLWWYRG